MREQSEIGPDQAGTDHAIMRRDDKAVDLLVAIVGEREHRPILAALAGAHFDAANDAVGTGRGRDLDAVVFGVLDIDRIGEIDCRRVGPHIDRFDRARGGHAEHGERDSDRQTPRRDSQALKPGGAQKMPKVDLRGRQPAPIAPRISRMPRNYLTALCAEFATVRFACSGSSPESAHCRALSSGCGRRRARNIPVYFQRVRTILPIWLPLPCAHAPRSLRASGKVESITGLTRPAAISGSTFFSTAGRWLPCRRPSARAASNRYG